MDCITTNSSLRRGLSLQISPGSLQPIDMISRAVTIRLITMIRRPIARYLRCMDLLRRPILGADERFLLHPLETSGRRVAASASPTISVQASPFRQGTSKTGCNFVSPPRLVPWSGIDAGSFFQWPPTHVSSISTFPEKASRTASTTTLRFHVRARTTRFRSIPVMSAMIWLLCSRMNRVMIAFLLSRARYSGRRCGVKS